MNKWKGNSFVFPLKSEDFDKLRKGGIVRTHFHPNPSSKNVTGICPECGKPLPIFIVVVSKKKVSPDDFEAEIRAGNGATSIQVTDADLDRIENTEQSLKAHYEDFAVYLVSQETYDKVKK